MRKGYQMRETLKSKWLVLMLMACCGSAMAHTHQGDEPMHTIPQPTSLFNITDHWTTSEDKSFQLQELEGKPTVITMIYTSCQYVCPVVVENMKKIQKAIPVSQAGKVNFVVVSFNPEDTADKLKEFGKTHDIESPSWILAYGNAKYVRKLAVALGIKYKKTKSGDYEHDTIVTILDPSGVIKYQQNALGQSMNGASLMLNKMLN